MVCMAFCLQRLPWLVVVYVELNLYQNINTFLDLYTHLHPHTTLLKSNMITVNMLKGQLGIYGSSNFIHQHILEAMEHQEGDQDLDSRLGWGGENNHPLPITNG